MTTQPQDPEQTADEPSSPRPEKVKLPRLTWGKESSEDTTPSSRPAAETDAGAGANPVSPQMSAPQLEPSSTKSGSSRGSSRGKSEIAQVTREAVATAIDGGTTLAHELLANDEFKRAVGLYLADEKDVEQVSDPVAKIVERHAGDAAAIANPDLADGIALAIAVLGYLSKQFKRLVIARRMREQGAAVTGLQPVVDQEQP